MAYSSIITDINWRSLHYRISLISIIPILLTIITGTLYRLLRAGFNIDKSNCKWLLSIHTMSIIPILNPIYSITVGLLLLLMILTGLLIVIKLILSILLTTTNSNSNNNNKLLLIKSILIPKSLTIRSIHRLIASILLLPLLITIVSGILYSLNPNKSNNYLLSIHQGSYLFNISPLIYITSIGTLASILIITAAIMIYNNGGGGGNSNNNNNNQYKLVTGAGTELTESVNNNNDNNNTNTNINNSE